jgi:hypothetical protein
MKRLALTAALVCGIGLLATTTAQAQPRKSYAGKPDLVFFLDRAKKKDDQSGKITDESPAKITMEGKITIPAGDIEDISYLGRLQVLAAGREKYGKALKAEYEDIDKAATGAAKKTAIQAAITAYQATLPELKAQPFAERHIEYKIATLTARLANEDPKERKAAIDLLVKFKKAHSDGWQISRAVQRLADLQIANEDFDGATTTLKVMEKMTGLPDDLKAQIPGRLVDVLLGAKKNKEASAQIDKLLAGMKPDSPEAFALKLKKSQVDGSVPGQLDKTVKQIDDLIKASKDRKQLAVCYNTKGQILLANNRAKEALYEFLYVDLIYNDDAVEQGKACLELAKLFDKIKQPARAKEYAEKAERLRK